MFFRHITLVILHRPGWKKPRFYAGFPCILLAGISRHSNQKPPYTHPTKTPCKNTLFPTLHYLSKNTVFLDTPPHRLSHPITCNILRSPLSAKTVKSTSPLSSNPDQTASHTGYLVWVFFIFSNFLPLSLQLYASIQFLCYVLSICELILPLLSARLKTTTLGNEQRFSSCACADTV